MKINLNDSCTVTLTENGVKALKDYYSFLHTQPPEEYKAGDTLTEQLWHVMYIFGNRCFMGPVPPIKPTIEIKNQNDELIQKEVEQLVARITALIEQKISLIDTYAGVISDQILGQALRRTTPREWTLIPKPEDNYSLAEGPELRVDEVVKVREVLE